MTTVQMINPAGVAGIANDASRAAAPASAITPEIQQLIDFVEGRLDPRLFSESLYDDPRYEELLNPDQTPWADTLGSENVYLSIISENFRSPDGLLKIHDILTKFLQRRGIAVKPTPIFREIQRLIRTTQPRWLDVDPEYVQREILVHAGGRKGAALKRWLRDEFLVRFRCITRPPRWLQGARWPISTNGPLVFLGQLPVAHYFHDKAAAYVFHDPASGICETIIQVTQEPAPKNPRPIKPETEG